MRLVVSNTTDEALSVTARAVGTAPRQHQLATFTLLAHQTRVLDPVSDLVGANGGTLMQTGGVSLTHTGAGGAVLARLFLEDADKGYSSWARFTDPAKGKANTYQGAGLRLGNVAGERLTPVVVARNVGTEATTITGRIPYTLKDGSTGVVTLPALQLAPDEAGTVDLTGALARSHIEHNVASAGLEFEHTGAAGSVLMGAQSVSQNLDQVFQVPLWDIEAQRSATGGYPWKIEGDTRTIVYIKNTTDRVQQYFLQLNYAGVDGTIAGTYATGLKSLAGGQTVALNLRKLRDEQVPDTKGHTIPLTATRGQLHWSMRGADNLVLIGRAEQVDTTRGLASSYACQNCCPDSFSSALASDCAIPTFTQDTSALTGTERDQDCYGSTYEYAVNGWVWIDWLSFAPSIATIDGEGLATGQSAGSTGIRAGWYSSTWYFDFVHGYCKSSPVRALANAACDVIARRVDDVSPARALIGQPVDVTITGSGFGTSTPTVNAGSDIVVSNVTLVNGGEIHARFTIASNAAPGNHSVSVRTSFGQTTTITGNFYVQIPTSLLLVIGNLRTHNGGAVTNCQGNSLAPIAYGHSRLLTYTVMDQSGVTAITQLGMTATEQVFKVSSNPANAGSDFTSTVPVTSSGTFCDVQAFFTNSPPAPQPGEYIKAKQLISITVPGRSDSVRVNCIDQEHNDLFITNTTSNPNATCQ